MYPNLVPRYGIQKRGNPFVEKIQQKWEIRDDSTSQCFDIMLLKDRKYLSNIVIMPKLTQRIG